MSSATNRLEIEYLPLDAIRPDPDNPRRHPKAQLSQLARNYQTFGVNVPGLVDRHNNLIAGHARLEAAKLAGLTSFPMIRLEHLSPAQLKAFAIADNRLAELSSWDDQGLGAILKELSALDLDFSLETTGFTMAEIDMRIEGLDEGPPGPDPADELPAILGPAVSQSGDLWGLGKHRLICGSALDIDVYQVLMGADRAAIVVADPPYNVRIGGNVSRRGKHREFAMGSGEMSDAQFAVFQNTVFRLVAEHSTDGSLHYIFMDWRHGGQLQAAVEPIYSELKNLCVWVKPNGGMGSLYRSRHELVFVFKQGQAAHQNNVDLGRHGRNRTNVWEYPGANTFCKTGEEGPLAALHPTVKPVAMIADILLDASSRGEVVLDPFLGSGSTLLAAERVGRVCRGIEIDPLYVDLAIRRWRLVTGEEAVHLASGKTFSQIEEGLNHAA